jgi:hypothetical protein
MQLIPDEVDPNQTVASKIQSVSDATGIKFSTKIQSVSPAIAKAKLAKKNQFAAPAGKKKATSFPIMKPKRSQFVRINPDVAYQQMNVQTLTDDEGGTVYYVAADLDLPAHIQDSVRLTNLYTAQMADGNFFIFPVRMSATNWCKALRAAVAAASKTWVAIVAARSTNSYNLIEPVDEIPEPDWSALPPFTDMLDSAFEGAMITAADHEYIRKLRGIRDDEDAE